jgi:hypothetical protein
MIMCSDGSGIPAISRPFAERFNSLEDDWTFNTSAHQLGWPDWFLAVVEAAQLHAGDVAWRSGSVNKIAITKAGRTLRGSAVSGL